MTSFRGLALAVTMAVGACAGVKMSGGAAGAGGAGGAGGRDGGGAGASGGSAVASGSGGSSATGAGGAGGTATGPCVNLQCQQTTCTRGACKQPACPAGQSTTVSGTVRDPAGKVPLYNVIVYVPNRALSPIPEGVSCDKCAGTASGGPIATALTDASGHFVLNDAPVGSNIPLVIQVGKWRRELTVPNVTACADNPIADADKTRLPRTKAEGHIPKIGVTTGGSDALECLLRKIGIADSEFTTDAGDGRVHLFVGGEPDGTLKGRGAASFSPALGGATLATATTLWGSVPKLMTYDLLLFSCEGSQYAPVKEPFVANIKSYVDAGGRLFNDHLHFYWLRNGPYPLPTTADYLGVGPNLPTPLAAQVDTSFPKGAALADWLVNVGASTTRGQIEIWEAQHSVAAVRAPTQRWIHVEHDPNDAQMRPATQYLTFNTPVEAAPENQCGRVVLTDIHVKSGPVAAGEGRDDSDPTKPFPTGCLGMTLSAQEKALEFIFFDLSSCIQEDRQPPEPPPVVP